jgi:hypothetical protein
MKNVLALAASLAATFYAIPAAWPCGGGGSSGGSSGGGSSGGGSSSSSSDSGGSYSAEPACVDTTDIHGYRNCTGYGTWRATSAAVAFELGFVSSMIDLSGIEAEGDIEHSDGTRYSYRVVDDDLGGERAAAAGLSLRLLFHGRRFYGGLESAFAVVGADEHHMEPMTRVVLEPRVTMATTNGAVFGAKVMSGSLPVSASAEMLGGVRTVSVTAESEHGACITQDTTVHASAVLEARVRADYWLTPRVSLGGWMGTDLISEAPSAGIVISSHLRAFDGAR